MAVQRESTTAHQLVQNALRVLEIVARRGTGVTEDELARRTALPATQLAGLLRMLRREGYVEQITDGAYVTGASLTRLGSAHDRALALRDKLRHTLGGLRDSIGAAVYVSRYVDGEIRVTDFADGPHTPKVNEWVDFRVSAHASAVGKSLLGQLDLDARRDHLSRHKMARLTSRTITSERVLLNNLDAQAATVPVLDLQEYAVGTVCAAVPITAGATVGSLALSLPVEHAHRLREAAETLNRKAAPVLLSLAI
ncbi:IclR family transcriptional regulator [Streptomyces flavofungini]|uniref:Helix-turn-helix domain-containing protein n=1 Tax=Streptomyces flavofungini TaxID=68200 RepID=A0ABS0XD05_9ACTN|nr:IclR family transcriptional regulator C-terminal domain-containing protein [Streptomyces flavofungini]MBJ3811102.1 helix-turn-helix domain-containing protein [Streptomyces flavofungini]GHC43883.1 IclR family transcriptional regulator [Streptomyces flavofungini]